MNKLFSTKDKIKLNSHKTYHKLQISYSTYKPTKRNENKKAEPLERQESQPRKGHSE